MDSLIQVPQHHIFSHFPNIAFNVVALAASMGGLKALRTILSALPADFPAAILVVQHLSPDHPNLLPQILSQRTALRVKPAATGDVLRPGTVYVAVPAHHLMVQPNGRLLLSDKHGGIAIAQDESTSEFFNMSRAAIATGKVDWVLPVGAIASTLVQLVTSEAVA